MLQLTAELSMQCVRLQSVFESAFVWTDLLILLMLADRQSHDHTAVVRLVVDDKCSAAVA